MNIDKYCVYLHTDNSGVPFFVGYGRERRARVVERSELKPPATGRGIKYSEKVKELDYNYQVVIHSWHNTSDEACETCRGVYLTHLSTLTNKNPPKLQNTLDMKELSSLFVIDENSPSGLSRKLMNGRIKPITSKTKGSYIGAEYYITIVDGLSLSVHRIILCLLGFNLDNKIVDHIDGNGLNNSIENLRLVNGELNARNTVRNRLNTTGVVGVSRNVIRKVEYYIASWRCGGKPIQKRFSIKKLGEEVAYQEAVKAREKAFEELNELGYGYTERHGTDKSN